MGFVEGKAAEVQEERLPSRIGTLSSDIAVLDEFENTEKLGLAFLFFFR